MTTKTEQNEEQNEFFEHYRFVCDKGQSAIRIDKYLMNKIENASRTKIRDAAKAGNILVNEKTVKPSYKIKPEDVIRIVLSFPPKEIEIIPEDIYVEIIFEDNDILIVNKKAGMVVHPAYANYSGTLVNALHYHFLHKSKYKNEDGQVYLAHRIDKDTSGILLVAKNELSQSRLGKQFFDHSIQRKYIALVWGDLKEDEGTIEGNIGRSLKNRKVMSVFPGGEYGKKAITHYKVIKRFGYVTLVECQLETGRTHQIRAHFKYIGHPLFNDATYGGDQILKGTTFTKYKQFVKNCFNLIPRQALHAKSLGFIHPGTKENMFFDSELPDDLRNVIDKWESYSNFLQKEEEL